MLIVDDEEINRELLGAIIGAEFDVVFARDGGEALEIIRRRGASLSLVMLDLLMPGVHGAEVLRVMKEEDILAHLPVIVLTSETSSEVECLRLGASDFISKPYNMPEVILARVRRTIELYEDRSIIRGTERDPVTGLYNIEYFYRYAEQFELRHPDAVTDAAVVDINHFHLINERYGKAKGDAMLRRVGEKILAEVSPLKGMVCRRGSDTFLIYSPHGLDFGRIMEKAASTVEGRDGGESAETVHLRMGVYACCDRDMDIERRFDRAKLAADTVRGSYRRRLAYYDESLHDREMYELSLIEDMPRALREGQFRVNYQPKYRISGDEPVLASAEALIRWEYPDLGMIPPGVFVPLFENNGMISSLDSYVWHEAAAQMMRWKRRYGFTVPVSVNVSRIDLYDPGLYGDLRAVLDESGADPSDLMLEVTESAYADDSDQIVRAVTALRDMGFKVEMDDFGSGYSSLSMLSILPVDILKMDMRFIQGGRGGERLLRLIIDIAGQLGIPAVAEGVETAQQVSLLKSLGCDIIQGYYFSKPVSADEFEGFIKERIKQC